MEVLAELEDIEVQCGLEISTIRWYFYFQNGEGRIYNEKKFSGAINISKCRKNYQKESVQSLYLRLCNSMPQDQKKDEHVSSEYHGLN